jgi:hypothetical protein
MLKLLVLVLILINTAAVPSSLTSVANDVDINSNSNSNSNDIDRKLTSSLFNKDSRHVRRRILANTPTRSTVPTRKPTASKPLPSIKPTPKPTASKPSPSIKPTASKPSPSIKPTSKPTASKPSPSIKPTESKPSMKPTTKSSSPPSPPSPLPVPSPSQPPPPSTPTSVSQLLPIGTMYNDPSSGTVYRIDTTTQYTEYKADGTCTSLPYYVINTNIYMKLTGTTMYTMRSGSKLTGVNLASNITTFFNIVTSNPNAATCDSTKSNYNTYSNVVDTLKQGNIYQLTRDSNGYW